MYKSTKGGKLVLRLEDNTYIALVDGNIDYQAYLAWVAQGNTAEPYADPPAPVPQSLTPRQGMIMLSRAGLLELVQELLADMEGQAGVEARIEFEKAAEWKRDWPILISMSAAIGLSSAQVDQMFIDGNKL